MKGRYRTTSWKHYSTSDAGELIDAMLQHYRRNVWPIVDAIVRSRLNNAYDRCLVFEGSAILPDEVVRCDYDRVSAVWLTVPADVLTNRILLGSRYGRRTLTGKRLIDRFLERTLATDRALMASVEANGQRSLDASSTNAFENLVAVLQ